MGQLFDEPYIEKYIIPPRFWAKTERVVVLPNDMSTFAEVPTENDMVVVVVSMVVKQCLDFMGGRKEEGPSQKFESPTIQYEFRRTAKKAKAPRDSSDF